MFAVFAQFRSGSWVLDGYIQLWERCIWVYTMFTLLCCLGTALLKIVGIGLLVISVWTIFWSWFGNVVLGSG